MVWKAIYDGLGRRIRTINSGPSSSGTTDAWYDPQVEFLEVGIVINGDRAWEIHGPDASGVYGGAQGIGGLEAVIHESDGAAQGVVSDVFGNVLGSIGANGAVTANDTTLGSYGPLPGSTVHDVQAWTDVIKAIAWRSRRVDPTGLICMGARYYEPLSGRFISPDPMGHGSSMSLYDYCGGDPLNRLDPTGRSFAENDGTTPTGYQFNDRSSPNGSYGSVASTQFSNGTSTMEGSYFDAKTGDFGGFYYQQTMGQSADGMTAPSSSSLVSWSGNIKPAATPITDNLPPGVTFAQGASPEFPNPPIGEPFTLPDTPSQSADSIDYGKVAGSFVGGLAGGLAGRLVLAGVAVFLGPEIATVAGVGLGAYGIYQGIQAWRHSTNNTDRASLIAGTVGAIIGGGVKFKGRVEDPFLRPGAEYSVRINPTTGEGPMAIDTSTFTSGETTQNGGIRNSRQFWKAWSNAYPQTISDTNLARINAGRAPSVDEQWIQSFPEHSDYMDETLIHHHLDYGPLAIPLPETAHGLQPGWSIWHQ